MPGDRRRDTIRKTAPVPYYVQLASILRAQIADGKWAPGQLIPSEADLGAFFAVSRTAVRQALQELVAEGLVHKEKGRGTFVSRPKAELAVQELRGFSEEMQERGHPVTTDLLALRLVPVPPMIAPELAVPMRAEVVELARVRRVGDSPVVLVRTHLPAPRFADLVDADLTSRSLYELLAVEYGVEPRSGHRHIEAVAADAAQARHLEVRRNAPLLQVTAVNMDQHGDPFEHFVAWYRGDRASFEVAVARPGELARPRHGLDVLDEVSQ